MTSIEPVLAMAAALGFSIAIVLAVLWRMSILGARWSQWMQSLSSAGQAARKGPQDTRGRSPRWARPRPSPSLSPVAITALALTVGAAAGSLLSAPLGTLVGAFMAAVLLYLARASARTRRHARLAASLRAFMHDLQITTASGELAGHSVALSASRAGVELRQQLERALAAHRSGASLHEAMSGIVDLRQCPEYPGLLQAIWLHEEAGASLAELVGAVVDKSDELLLLQGDVAAKVADARWTARILAGVPLMLFAYLMLFERWALAPLLEDPTGRVALAAGTTLWLTGILVIWRMTLLPAEFAGPA